jgi:hypothetical protein
MVPPIDEYLVIVVGARKDWLQRAFVFTNARGFFGNSRFDHRILQYGPRILVEHHLAALKYHRYPSFSLSLAAIRNALPFFEVRSAAMQLFCRDKRRRPNNLIKGQ